MLGDEKDSLRDVVMKWTVWPPGRESVMAFTVIAIEILAGIIRDL